jgi:release factor glutamine methyltransferase
VTIRATVADARGRLSAAGIPPPEAALDARLLAQELLGWNAARFHADADREPSLPFLRRYAALSTRRAAREPLAYIVGHREFWGLTFEVSPAVLVPRPETEIVVETALHLFEDRNQQLSVADVGTGSGNLAVAIAYERPRAVVVGTDVSPAALAVASRNAARHGVSDRVRLQQVALLGDDDQRFDLIVSNPPYIADRDRATLQPEVRDYEPPAALFGGPDGLAVIRQLVAAAPARLRQGGALIFELGAEQAAAAEALISSTPGLTMADVRPDLQGIARVVVARSA